LVGDAVAVRVGPRAAAVLARARDRRAGVVLVRNAVAVRVGPRAALVLARPGDLGTAVVLVGDAVAVGVGPRTAAVRRRAGDRRAAVEAVGDAVAVGVALVGREDHAREDPERGRAVALREPGAEAAIELQPVSEIHAHPEEHFEGVPARVAAEETVRAGGADE